MIVTTTETVAGRKITSMMGMVQGSTIRARNIGHDLTAMLKNITGGEITEYTKLMAEAREQCLDRMREQAVQLGANGIVATRFVTTEVMQGAAELVCYGTAVVLEDESP